MATAQKFVAQKFVSSTAREEGCACFFHKQDCLV